MTVRRVSPDDRTAKLTPLGEDEARPAPPQPGLVVVFHAGRACFRPLPVARPTVLGWDAGKCDVVIEDDGVSARHVRVAFDERGWTFEDLKSSNRTYVDAEPVQAATLPNARTLFIGQTVLLVARDLGVLGTGPETIDGTMIAGAAMRRVLEELRPAAEEGAPILLLGETGTGKEQVARWCHRHGRHAGGPFVDVDVGGLKDDLAPGLLFGTVRGSHSTATHDTKGYYEQADRGMLFFDELGRMALDVQSMNLRALQERRVRPLGGTKSVSFDIDLCTATNCDLEAMVREGSFLQDLYYRFAHAVVTLPPLRERVEEIPFLIERIIAARGSPRRPSAEFVLRAVMHSWPGNVRELAIIVGRALRDLSKPELRGAHVLKVAASARPSTPAPAAAIATPAPTPATKTYQEMEKERIVKALEENAFHITNTARALGMHRETLARKMRECGLSAKRRGGTGEGEGEEGKEG